MDAAAVGVWLESLFGTLSTAREARGGKEPCLKQEIGRWTFCIGLFCGSPCFVVVFLFLVLSLSCTCVCCLVCSLVWTLLLSLLLLLQLLAACVVTFDCCFLVSQCLL